LGQALGVSKEKVEKLSSRNVWNVLTLEIGVLEELMRWLSERLGLKENEMQRMAQKHPILLQRNSNTLAPKLEYLQTRLLFDDASLRKLVLRHPTVFNFSTEDNVTPKLDWLQQRVWMLPKSEKS